MKQLFLLRHAKSSWDDSELVDHDRRLAPRGQRVVRLIAEHLGREGVTRALVLCSSARRTRETLEGIAPALGEATPVEIEDDLYAASERRLLERLRAVEDDVESLMLLGHNPGVEQLALSLAGGGEKLADSAPEVSDRRACDARVQRPLGRPAAGERGAHGLRHAQAAGQALSGCFPVACHSHTQPRGGHELPVTRPARRLSCRPRARRAGRRAPGPSWRRARCRRSAARRRRRRARSRPARRGPDP